MRGEEINAEELWGGWVEGRPCLATDLWSTLPPQALTLNTAAIVAVVCRCSRGICGLRQAKKTHTALGDCFPLLRPLILDFGRINTSSTPLSYILIKQLKLCLMDMHPSKHDSTPISVHGLQYNIIWNNLIGKSMRFSFYVIQRTYFIWLRDAAFPFFQTENRVLTFG